MSLQRRLFFAYIVYKKVDGRFHKLAEIEFSDSHGIKWSIKKSHLTFLTSLFGQYIYDNLKKYVTSWLQSEDGVIDSLWNNEISQWIWNTVMGHLEHVPEIRDVLFQGKQTGLFKITGFLPKSF